MSDWNDEEPEGGSEELNEILGQDAHLKYVELVFNRAASLCNVGIQPEVAAEEAAILLLYVLTKINDVYEALPESESPDDEEEQDDEF